MDRKTAVAIGRLLVEAADRITKDDHKDKKDVPKDGVVTRTLPVFKVAKDVEEYAKAMRDLARKKDRTEDEDRALALNPGAGIRSAETFLSGLQNDLDERDREGEGRQTRESKRLLDSIRRVKRAIRSMSEI